MVWRRILVPILSFVLAASAVLSASSATAAVAVPSHGSPTATDRVGQEVAPALVRLASPQSSPRAPEAIGVPLHVTSSDLCSTVVPRLKELAAEGKAAKGNVACIGSSLDAQNGPVPSRPTPYEPSPIPKARAMASN